MSCTALIPGGSARQGCITKQVTNIIPLYPGTTFANYLAAQNVETWRGLIQEDLHAYPTLPISNVSPTKPSTNKESDGSGAETTTRLSPGGAVVNLKTNACDFKEMLLSMQGGEYPVVIGLGADEILMYEKPSGVLTGFTGQITAIPTGMPGKDAKMEEFQLDINWQDIEEWKNYRIIKLPFFISELVELTPTAIDAKLVTALSSTSITYHITQRCSDVAETDTFTAEVLSSNVDVPAVTVSAGSAGDYILTVEKDTIPVVLAAGDYIKIRLVKMSTDVYTKISQIITLRLWT